MMLVSWRQGEVNSVALKDYIDSTMLEQAEGNELEMELKWRWEFYFLLLGQCSSIDSISRNFHYLKLIFFMAIQDYVKIAV